MNFLNRIIDKTGLRGHSRGMWVLTAIQVVRSVGHCMAFVYVPLYAYEQRHMSMTLVGVVFLVSGIAGGAFQIIGGILADRFGNRRMYVLCSLIEAGLWVLFAAVIVTNMALWSFLAVWVSISASIGVMSPAGSALIADVSGTDRLNESYGLMAIGGNLGFAIGPLVGGYLKSGESYSWVFVAAAATICLALASLPFIPADTTGKSAGRFSVRDLRASLLDLRLIAFCVICTLFFFQMGQWGSTLSVFSVDRVKLTTEQYGLLMSVAGLLIVIFQYPVSRSVGWMGARTALAFGSLLYAVGFLSLGWAGSFWAVLISIVVMVPGEMLFIPTSYEVIVQISRPGDRAKNLGLLGLFATLGQSLGPLFGGALLDKFKSQPLFVWGPVAVPGAIATIGFLLWRGYASKSVGKAIVKTEQATKDHIN